MSVRKMSILIICLLLFTFKTYSQDPQFTQFYTSQLYLAPSFAGAVESSRITMGYRNQWMGDNITPFHTFMFSYDHYFTAFKSGIGLLFVEDVAGTGQLGTMSAKLLYSYNFDIFPGWAVRPGLQFGYIRTGLAWDKLIFYDQLLTDPNSGTINYPADNAQDIDFGLSLITYSKWLWFGATVDHLLKPNLAMYSNNYYVPIKTSIYGGVTLIRKTKLLNPFDETLSFAFLYKNQGDQQQLDLGLYWFKNFMVFGFWYRGIPVFHQRGDALAFLVGLKTTNVNVGYSYDLTISNILGSVYGSHEITLTYKFKVPKKKKYQAVPCPHF
jgi:type IX secretion system PorP/SprF family membrane protein